MGDSRGAAIFQIEGIWGQIGWAETKAGPPDYRMCLGSKKWINPHDVQLLVTIGRPADSPLTSIR